MLLIYFLIWRGFWNCVDTGVASYSSSADAVCCVSICPGRYSLETRKWNDGRKVSWHSSLCVSGTRLAQDWGDGTSCWARHVQWRRWPPFSGHSLSLLVPTICENNHSMNKIPNPICYSCCLVSEILWCYFMLLSFWMVVGIGARKVASQ